MRQLAESIAVLGGGGAAAVAARISALEDADSFVFTGATGSGLGAAEAKAAALGAGGAWGSAAASAAVVVAASAAVEDTGAGVTAWGVAAAWSVEADAVADAAAALLTSYTSGQGGLGVFSDFNVEIIFNGTWTEDLQARFIVAAEYLSTIITGDVRGGGRAGVDDIRIEASLEPIDGAGGILGQAGPTGLRFFSKLPTTGIMQFDIADAENFDNQGLFDDIVLHEMMHCLGLGTIWDRLGLTSGSIQADNLIFTGANAILAYNTEFAAIAANDPNAANGVPVETDGGSGTAGGHWDDETFTNELMTGFISPSNYVSSMTVASFEDCGYDTIWDASNPGAVMPQPDDLLI